MIRELEISRDIAATPAAVFAVITDVTRTGEWSDECTACEWIGGATGPAIGAEFDGHNSNNGNQWTTQGKVVELVDNERFVFHATSRGFHFATWGYSIEPTDAGCRLTQFWEDLRPEAALAASKSISGVEDRAEFNRQNMTNTLDRIAAIVEG